MKKGNLLPLTDKFLCVVNKGRYITGSSFRTSSSLIKETPLSQERVRKVDYTSRVPWVAAILTKLHSQR